MYTLHEDEGPEREQGQWHGVRFYMEDYIAVSDPCYLINQSIATSPGHQMNRVQASAHSNFKFLLIGRASMLYASRLLYDYSKSTPPMGTLLIV